MKNSVSKICAALGGLCLAVMISVANHSVVTASGSSSTLTEAKPETRCGWFSNPTPSNAWLDDKDGEWLISMQGGYQAEGDWASFKPNQWVETNGSYGYGCSCMQVTTDKKTRRILTIKNAVARPLAVCRKDKKLKKPE